MQESLALVLNDIAKRKLGVAPTEPQFAPGCTHFAPKCTQYKTKGSNAKR